MLNRPFIFFNFTILFIVIYFLLFGLIFKFKHSFNSYQFFPFVIISHLIICFLFYAFSSKNFITAPGKQTFSAIKQHIVIVSLFLLCSSAFPISSLFDIYPSSMAVFHSILLFLISISFLSTNTALAIVALKGMLEVSIGKKILLLSSIIIPGVVCLICMGIFGVFT
ncbi:MAG: hypothetical protein ACRENO_05720 [Thermodesulfobacteriota bacterium]